MQYTYTMYYVYDVMSDIIMVFKWLLGELLGGGIPLVNQGLGHTV